MLYEFQVFYRVAPARAAEGTQPTWPAQTGGQIYSALVRAGGPDEAGRLITAAPGLVLVSVGPGRQLLPDKPTYNLAEAAAYLDISERTLRDLQAKGELPRPQWNGHSLFRIEELEQYRSRSMRLEEWKQKG
jgi:excisionase family DNA binding protein